MSPIRLHPRQSPWPAEHGETSVLFYEQRTNVVKSRRRMG
jgi:hypothetical protein